MIRLMLHNIDCEKNICGTFFFQVQGTYTESSPKIYTIYYSTFPFCFFNLLLNPYWCKIFLHVVCPSEKSRQRH